MLSTSLQHIPPSLLTKSSVLWQLTCFAELSGYQVYNIIQAREQVFVKDQNCSYIDADGIDFEAMHLSAYQDDVDKQKIPQLLAYCRIIPPVTSNDGYPHIGRVLVLGSYRGQGLARQLMVRAINYCHSQFPKQPIHISAQTYLIKFYQSLNFVCEGEVYSDGGIEHIPMILADSSVFSI